MKKLRVPCSHSVVFRNFLAAAFVTAVSIFFVGGWLFYNPINYQAVLLILAAGAFSGSIIAVSVIYYLRRPTLVFSRDQIQMEYKNGKIAGQVPYENIKRVFIEERTEGRGQDQQTFNFLVLKLRKANDESTWWPKIDSKKVSIPDEFEKQLDWLMNHLGNRIGAYEERMETEEADSE